MSRPLVLRTTALVVLYTAALLTYRLSGHPGLFALSLALLMLGVAALSPIARALDSLVTPTDDARQAAAGSLQPTLDNGNRDGSPGPCNASDRLDDTLAADAISLDALEAELARLERRFADGRR